jgi:hypothetical protein
MARETEIVFVDEDLTYHPYVINEDRLRHGLYFKPYLQLQGSAVSKERCVSQRITKKEILITMTNDSDYTSKRLSRELTWDEYHLFWKGLLDGKSLDDICKELNFTYEVGDFLLF